MGNLEGYTLRMLLTHVFEWAYEEDVNLYKNLDLAFEAFKMRQGIDSDKRKQLQKEDPLSNYTVYELLEKAIAIADFQDIVKFNQAFVYNHHSTNKAHYTHGWKFDDFTPHPYSGLIQTIRNRSVELETKGLASWHKSDDHDKHAHFRFWMQEFLRTDKRFSLRLFVVNSGNTRSFETLYVGSNESYVYEEIVSYILEKNIVPDPHHQKVEVPDYVNPDNHNERFITRSGRHGGFWYLVYLTAAELQEIYETQTQNNLDEFESESEKPMWAYINALPKDEYTKFYLFFT